MKIIFMGTPDFSVGTLEALIAAGHEITLVVSQPDKPKGRGHELQPTPVKEAALKHGLTVYQPKKVRDPEVMEKLRETEADVIVVIAFGQIIPKSILEMKQYGCINVHASLLPEIPRRGPDSVGGYRRREGERRDHHADGRGAGYRRYAPERKPGSGGGRDRRKPL